MSPPRAMSLLVKVRRPDGRLDADRRLRVTCRKTTTGLALSGNPTGQSLAECRLLRVPNGHGPLVVERPPASQLELVGASWSDRTSLASPRP